MATSARQELAARPVALVRRFATRRLLTGALAGAVPFVVAFAAYGLAFAVMDPKTIGDEPHYLLVAESIAFDGDVDLRNDYASRERTLRVTDKFPLDPHAAEYKGSDALRPVHGVGLSAVLAPAVALGGLTGARIAMVLLAALLAHQLYRLLADLGFRRRYAVGAWVAVALCLPLVAFSSQVYPEIPGALLVVVVLRVILRGTPSTTAVALASTASAALVWLHVRYIPISLALLLALAYVVTSDRRPRVESVERSGLRGKLRTARAELFRRSRVAAEHWRTVVVPTLVPYAVILAAFALAFEYWYGSPDPRAAYYAYSTTTIGSGGWGALYDFVVQDVFSPLVGWIPFAPVHWLGLAALGCLVVAFGWPAGLAIGAAAAYELGLASAAPAGGWQFPARYLLIIVPLVAVPIALAIQRLRLARIVFVPLLAGSLVFAVAAVRNHEALYPGEKQRIFGLRSIAPAFPVTRPAEAPTSFAITAGNSPPTTGVVRGDRVIARAGRDEPGYLLYGPYSPLMSGEYRATFSLAARGAAPTEPVASLEVVGGAEAEAFFAQQTVLRGDLRSRRLTKVALRFATPGDHAIETRVYYSGQGTLIAGDVEVEPIAVAEPAPARLRDWPLAFVWIGGTILVGALFVQVMTLGQRRADAEQ
jgi:hypothetical protein